MELAIKELSWNDQTANTSQVLRSSTPRVYVSAYQLLGRNSTITPGVEAGTSLTRDSTITVIL